MHILNRKAWPVLLSLSSGGRIWNQSGVLSSFAQNSTHIRIVDPSVESYVRLSRIDIECRYRVQPPITLHSPYVCIVHPPVARDIASQNRDGAVSVTRQRIACQVS